MGRAAILFVTILSILSENDSFSFEPFFTAEATVFSINVYLSFVIMLSVSSSKSFSADEIILSRIDFLLLLRFRVFIISPSFSNIFTANHFLLIVKSISFISSFVCEI